MLLDCLHHREVSVCPARQMLPVLYLLHMLRLSHHASLYNEASSGDILQVLINS